MRVLSFDTAMNACSAAVTDETGIRAHRFEEMTRGHSERLVPLIEAVLQDAGVDAASLEAIATTVGPGAFTGIRIGLSTARALGLALNIPVLGFSTFEALLEGVGVDGQERASAVVVETKRTDFYLGLFASDGSPAFDPCAVEGAEALSMIAKLGPVRVFGDGADRLLAEAGPLPEGAERIAAPDIVDATALGRLAIRRMAGLSMQERQGFLPPSPLYLRPPDVSKPKPRAVHRQFQKQDSRNNGRRG